MSAIHFVDRDSLVNVFKQLPLGDIFSCTRVNTEWNTAALDDALWRFFISKVFPRPSNMFLADTQNTLQLSQKEVFKYSHHLELGRIVEEQFPEFGSPHLLRQNGRHFLISESGAVYVWNEKTETFELIKKLWELPQSHEYPHNVYTLSLCAKQVLGMTEDTFAVLCEKSGYEIRDTRVRYPKQKKATGSLLKIFNNAYKEIKEISLNSKMRDLRVLGSGQFIGITNSNVLTNITEKFVQTHKFTNGDQIEILSLNCGKCLVLGLGHENHEDRYTLSLFDMTRGTHLIGEIISDSRPRCPLNSELFSHRFILLPNEENCQIFDLDQGLDAPRATIPFGKDFMKLAFFTPQGKLLLSNLRDPQTTFVLLDPENEWQQVQTEVKRVHYLPKDREFLFSYGDQDFLLPFMSDSANIVSKEEKLGKVVGNGMILRNKQFINCDPSNKKLVLHLANDLANEGVVRGFDKLPERVRNVIYEELYRVLDERGALPSVSSSWAMREDAFHNRGPMKGIATTADKVQAMQRAADLI